MKKLSFMCTFVCMVGLMSSPAFTIEYGVDFLESSNPGGWTSSLKTFDSKSLKGKSKEVTADIWIKDVPEPLISTGFLITCDPSKLSIGSVEIYDGSVLPGPWDRGMAKKEQDTDGPGTYKVFCVNMGTIAPDKNGDIIIAKVRFLCKDKCNPTFKISTIPTIGFDSVVGGDSGSVYDSKIKPLIIE